MHVPVKDEQGHIRLLHVMIETVFLQIDRNGDLVFHTERGKYTLIRRLEDWASWLEAETADFLRVDRGTIVNLRKPWQFAPDLRVLELRDDHGGIRIPVSEKIVAALKTRMKLERTAPK